MKTQPLALLAGIGLALVIGLPATAPARADTGPCEPAAAEQLQGLGIAATEVKEISMIEVQDNQEFGTPSEWQAWAKLQSCSGNVVIKLSTRCRVKETYTRGDCKIANIANY
jgi:hypothetical protein